MKAKFIFYFVVWPMWATYAQGGGNYPVTVTVFNEGVSVPFTQFVSRPLHPGIMLESNRFFNEGSKSSFGWSVSVGYYFHRHFAQGLFAQAHMLYRYKTNSGVYGQVQLGTGYLHVFRTAPEYRLENGRYVKHADWGSGRMAPSFGLELGYALNRSDVLSPRVFTRYQAWVQYPFSPGFIPLLSHTNLHLGYSFYPFKEKR
ncbi:MAG: hypothetical protein ACOYW3_02985 [Bacteroidota bacterium]